LGPQRDYTSDSTYGIEQLRTIGWTTASTAKEDPSAALLVVDSLHDILARWLEPRDPVADSRAPIVLADHVPDALLEALGAIGLIAIKGLQHRTVARVVQILATHLPALPAGQRSLVDQIVQTLLKNVPPTFQTPDVANAFAKLADAYAATGETTLANRIELAITGRGTDAAQSGQLG
jgi:uncharacterized membrane protein